jgi:hypothetical protein
MQKAKELCTVFRIILLGSKEITYLLDGQELFYIAPAQTQGITALIRTVLQIWNLAPIRP